MSNKIIWIDPVDKIYKLLSRSTFIMQGNIHHKNCRAKNNDDDFLFLSKTILYITDKVDSPLREVQSVSTLKPLPSSSEDSITVNSKYQSWSTN